MKISVSPKSIDENIVKLNGINDITMTSENILKVNFNPEAISARKIAYYIEDKLLCKATYHQNSQGKLSLVKQQQENMKC